MGLVARGAPNSLRCEVCSYCHGKIDDDDVSLMLCMADGTMAQFCDQPVDLLCLRQGKRAHHRIFLGEKELSDVSLSTFYVFDKES
jgi:hypothetical protein